jgi:hypothetical protein
MHRAIIWLALSSSLLGVTACAVSTEEPEFEEQVGTMSEELRFYHLPNTGLAVTTQSAGQSCVEGCAAALSTCEAGNASLGPNAPMDPCDYLFYLCIQNCPPPPSP